MCVSSGLLIVCVQIVKHSSFVIINIINVTSNEMFLGWHYVCTHCKVLEFYYYVYVKSNEMFPGWYCMCTYYKAL